MGLARFGAPGGSSSQAVQRQIRKDERLQWGSQRGRVQRQAECIVERSIGDLDVGNPIDALLRYAGQVYPNGEHIDIGGHACSAHRFGAFQVGLGRANSLLRGLEALRRQDRAIVGAHRLGDDIHLYQSLFFASHLPDQFSGLHRIPRLTGIEYGLIHRDLRLKVVERIRPVQGPDGKVVDSELVLGKQRTEDEDGVIAAREGLGVTDFWQHPAAGLRDPGLGRPRSSGCTVNRLVLPDRPERLRGATRILRPKGNE